MAKPSPKTKRQALGRGLSALIPQGDEPRSEALQRAGLRELPLDQIDASDYQARTHFDPRSLQELAQSIKNFGLLQAPVVKPEGDRFELISGERRVRAARMAGLKTIPVIVRDSTDQEQMELGLIENIQRSDLNPIEEARGYAQLMEVFELTQAQVADRLGKSRSFITNRIRLLKLPEEIQTFIADGKLSEGHARALLAIDDPDELLAAAARVIEQGLTVRDTEGIGRQASGRRKKSRPIDPDWEALRRDLESALGTTVKVSRGRKGGSLTIRFYDDEQLDGIIQKLTRGR